MSLGGFEPGIFRFRIELPTTGPLLSENFDDFFVHIPKIMADVIIVNNSLLIGNNRYHKINVRISVVNTCVSH